MTSAAEESATVGMADPVTPLVLPYGPRAVLVECRPSDVAAIARAVRSIDGVTSLVPAARTVLVEHDGRDDVGSAIGDAVHGVEWPDDATATGSLVEIPVRYDGEDLADVASACGLTVSEVVALHTGTELVSAFCGFAPGFAYLTGLPEPLASLPRRQTPRTRVPAGSVAIAGGYSAVYPSASPGGWHLLGRTDAVLWDPMSTTPALLAPGTRVRFVPVPR